MKFKLVKEEAGQKVERQQQRSFNTGTILDASVGTLSDGDKSHTRTTFESHGEKEVRVRVDVAASFENPDTDNLWTAEGASLVSKAGTPLKILTV
ncbi:hypothetical protein [Corallococcus sp. AB018]|uniref:hypothetical protein n=1 Tax=Corallococcus sp. AB018 TaxID=2316715 RepID=UPI001F199E3B|nr:hypothetical protein [Corallococcus sp. AB018]